MKPAGSVHLPWRGSMARRQRRMRSSHTGTEPTTTFGFWYWMWPHAGHTARACVSPCGTLYSTLAPQALQWLMGTAARVIPGRASSEGSMSGMVS